MCEVNYKLTSLSIIILKIGYNLSRWKLKIKPLLKQTGSVSHYSKVEKYSTLLIQIYFSLITGKLKCNQLNFPGKEAKLFQLFLLSATQS